MSMKSPTSYSQEDLDLINSEIPSFVFSIPTTSSDQAQKSSTNTDTHFPNVEEFQNNLNTLNIDDLQNACSLELNKEVSTAEKNEFIQNENVAIPDQAVQEIANLPVIVDDATKNFHQGIENIRLQSERKIEKENELKTKSVNRRGLNFFPGDKLEAKDFNEKWYSARVVETDWVEREVLIHFDKWSSRFDEWIPMDSPRLRVLQVQSREMKTRDFVAGERILATWADGRKYPAKVNAVLGNDRYDVHFDDGYVKIIRSSKMTKIGGPLEEEIDGEDIIGSKEKRKDRNRKYQVMDLFQRKSKKLNPDKHPRKGRPSKEGPSEPLLVESESPSGSHDDSGTEVLHGFDNSTPKVKTYLKKDKKEKTDTELEESVRPEWIDGEPQGIESYIEGPRRSIIVADKRLPPGWQKHFTQRKAGSSAGKWDVLFIHQSSDKKFRSRNDIRSYMATQGMLDFDPEKFDFCIHRKKKTKPEKPKSEADPVKKPKSHSKAKHTLVPEYSPVPGFSTPTSSMTPSSSVDDGAVFIGDLRIEMEDSSYKCPKEGCLKNFRKENLLQMHIKHYHPEYSKFLGSTPNVADLAYARTIGESIGDIIPKQTSNFMEKINKFERRKGSHDKSQLPVLHSALSPSQLLSTSMPSPTPPVLEVEVGRPEDLNNFQREEKHELGSPVRGNNENARQDNDCAMSPGTLFDLKLREEKTQTGIKTLLPVRSAVSERFDKSKPLEEAARKERGRSQRKRHISDYQPDVVGRSKKKNIAQDLSESIDDTPLNTTDPEGRPTTYRFSRRKLVGSKHNGIAKNKNGEMTMLVNGEVIKVEQLRKEEIINCTCKVVEEDGLMIQCDLCLCWQHGHCNAIEKEKDVPDKYVCYICRHPYRQRPSKKYIHDQEWMKTGKLPSLPDRTKNELTIKQRTAMLKRSCDLVSSLLQIQTLLHSLRVKINVAQKKDHPKLYLWAKNWEKFVIPKPDITPVPVLEVSEEVDEPDIKLDKEETKLEDQSIKEDPDDKSIATDSELVKILEEDGTHSDESKVVNKVENSASQNDHFLLDALTKSSSLEENLKTETSNDILDSQDAKKSTNVETKSGVLSENGISTQAAFSSPQTKRSAALPSLPFIPEPEAPIDPTECRMRLLEHIDHYESYVSSTLTSIEAQVQVLEEMDPDLTPESDIHPRTKQTVQMLLRDLSTIRKLAAIC